MVDELPAYSLTYSNCQHFVADLAEKIIPIEKMDLIGIESTTPALTRMMHEIRAGEYSGHGEAVINRVADLTLGASHQTSKFFHFTTAIFESMAKFSWRPYERYERLLRADNLREIAAHAREDQRLGPRYIEGQFSGNSSTSGPT